MKRTIYVIMMLIISLSLLSASPSKWLTLPGSAITADVMKEIRINNQQVRGPSFNFSQTPFNLPTTGDPAFLEDTPWTKNFTAHINNPGGGTLYLYYSNPEHFDIVQDAGNPLILTFTPKPTNWNGSEMVILTVSDTPLGRTERAFSTAIVRLNVTPVPDPPILSFPLIFPPQFLEDTTLTVNFADYIQCVDSAADNFDLYLTQTQLPPFNIEISQVPANVGQSVTFSPKLDFNGQVNFVLTAVDRTTSALVSTTITVSVQGVNDAPVIDSFIPVATNQTIEQYTGLNFSVTAHDVDNFPLTYSWTVSGTHNGVPFSNVFSSLSTAAYTFNFPGVYTVTTNITDGLFHVSQSWNVTVQPTGPLFNPWGGVYQNPVTLTLSPPADYSTAPVYYTLDGTQPSNTSLLFNPANPILIPAVLNNDNVVTVKAIYYATGLPPSSIITQVYQITGTVGVPVFSPNPAVTYYEAQTVQISTPTIGASIYYTEDGTNPVVGAPNTFLYSALTPITVPLNTVKVIKAISVKTDWQTSSIVTATYTVTGGVHILNYEFNPSPGNYDVPLGDFLLVNINNIVLDPADAVLHYTIDNSIPTVSSPVYNAGHTFTFSTPTTVRIRAFKTNWQPSDIISVEYNIAGQIVINPYAAPNGTVFNPAPAIYSTSQNIVINNTTPVGGTIYYSIDGVDPVVGAPNTYQYTGPILVTSTRTIKVVATYPGLRPSPIYQGSYTITGTVATPVFMPGGGVYPTAQDVTITCLTPGASIYYTLSGNDPVIGNADTFLYTAPFTVTIPVGYSTLKARAFLNTWEPSAIMTSVYSIARLPMPAFNLVSGTYPVSQTIHLTDVSGRDAEIYYTLDNTEPTESSNLYNDLTPIVLAENTTTIIRAKAFKVGWNPSEEAMRRYEITGTVSTPQFAPPAGTYPTSIDVSIVSTTPGATIRYTLNGIIPTSSYGTVYTTPIPVTSGMTIKAIAYKTDWLNSVVATADYVISGIVGNPVFTPPAGTYPIAQQVYLSVIPIDASIRYTTDGSDPSEVAGIPYVIGTPIAVNSSQTLKAFAYKAGWTSSQIVTADYIITGIVATPTFNPPAGEYATTQTVQISTTTPGATIRYTLDGSDPSEINGFLYDTLNPIIVAVSSNIKAVAFKAGWIISPVSNAAYTINGIVSNPVFSPIAGSYNLLQTVSIQSFPTDATIRYTTDGSIPSAINGTIYTLPFTVDAATTIKAIAYKTSWVTSGVSTASYSFNVLSPVNNPIAGVYSGNQTISISCPTPGVTIRYTTDGLTDPSSTVGTIYAAPFVISTNTTIKVIAYRNGWNDSPVVSSNYIINGSVMTPIFSVASGTYNVPFNVSISTTPTDATIRYTTDGSTPTNLHGNLYLGPISIIKNTNLKAIAYRTGWENSAVAAADYILKVVDPVLSLIAGTYNTPQTMTITTTTADAYIRYTLDGSVPSSTVGTLYTGAFLIDSNLIVKAIAYKLDWESSNVVQNAYNFNLSAPTFNPPAGLYNEPQMVTISAGAIGASIRYTLDGTDPSEINGVLYAGPILISEAKTIKAIAYKSGWNSSTIASASYTFGIATPIFNPVAGNYGSAQNVAITTPTVGASIRYTTDGSIPSETDGILYTDPILVNVATTIKAIAFMAGWNSTAVVRADYTFKVADPTFDPVAGIYASPQSVSISSSTVGAEIRYTLDGTDPTPTVGTVFVGAISIPDNTTQIIKAIAYLPGWQNSNITSAGYIITGTVTLSEPVFSVLAGTYQTAQTVSVISAAFPADAVIHYTTDGSVPTEASPVYAGAVTVPMGTSMTIKVRAFKADWIPSTVYSATYNVTGQIALPTPLFIPAAGDYQFAQFVTLNPNTIPAGADLRYTTDGSDPTEASLLYSSPIAIPQGATTTLKVRAYKVNWIPSDIATAIYHISNQVVFNLPVFTPPSGTYDTSQSVVINTAIPVEATVHYTIDGTDPTIASPLYTVPIIVAGNSPMVIKACAFAAGYAPSTIETAVYNANIVPTPLFSLASGTYVTQQFVDITVPVAGADIYYTLDGTEPNTGSTLYSGTITLNTNHTYTFRAKAFKAGWINSLTASTTYIITGQVADVVFSPLGGNYTVAQNVILTTPTEGASIRYTIDGSIPDATSSLYSIPIHVPLNSSINIKAIALKNGWVNSNIGSQVYNITGQVVFNLPVFSPGGGVYTSAQTITINTPIPADATIRYTTDGTDPNESTGTIYTVPFTVSTSQTIKAIAYKTNWTSSSIATAFYDITGFVADVTFDIPGGTYQTSQNIALSTVTAGAVIRYTTNGSEPSEASASYTVPINIPLNSTMTIKAKAYKANWISSSTTSQTYVITGQIVFNQPVFTPPAGIYTTAQTISLNTVVPADAQIRYTTDGTEPNLGSNAYVAPLLLPLNSTLNLNVKAFKADWTPSVTYSASYNVTGQVTIAQPIFTPDPGLYTTPQMVSINTSVIPAEAVIHYTIDGTNPTESSPVYVAPISIGANQQVVIKVRAYAANWIPGEIQTGLYTITDQVAPVVFNPIGGTFSTAQNVFLTTLTDGATIHYTTDGTEPNIGSTLYTSAITVPLNSSVTINAKAFKTNWTPSITTSQTYVINSQVAFNLPVFSPAGGTYSTDQTVTISTPIPNDATVKYTTDGSLPSAVNGIVYSGPILINTNSTIKVYAFKVGWQDSEIAQATYVFQTENPVLSLASGTYTSAQVLTITSPTAGSQVRYTTDGTDPSAINGSLYTLPITISVSQTVKAIAFKTDWNPSAIVTGTYEITGQVADVTFNIPGGTYQTTQSVALSTITAGATIRFTTDGSEPSEASATYINPIIIPLNTTMVIKAKAYKTGWNPSTTTSQTYIITGQVAFNHPVFNPPAGIYTTAQTITLNTVLPADAVIRYTTDGTEPNLTSAIYAVPLLLPLNNTLDLKVKAFKTDWTASLTYSATYNITGQVTMAQPIFTPAPGLYTTPQLISINTSVIPTNAVIHYTIDGTIPNESSPIYGAPISIGANQQIIINVRAYAANWIPSDIQTGVYNVTDMVAPVTFNPIGGTYATAQTVFLSTTTEEASIRYTTDGSEPTSFSTLYTSGILVPLNSSVTIKAKAFKANWTSSVTVEQTYIITGQVVFNQPIFSPVAGVYTSALNVAISTPIPADATVRYTTDGTDPSETIGTIYSGPITVSTSQTIKVIAYKENWTSSNIASAFYDITGQVADVTFDIPGGTYQNTQNISLSTLTADATIRYTTDGSEPSEASASYNAPINIPLNTTMVLKAKAYKLNWDPSNTTTQTYVITGQIVFNMPVFTPPAGIYTSAQTISLNSVIPSDALITYTTDGSEPIATSTPYVAPLLLPLNSTLDLKVKAFKADWIPSLTYSASYNVTGQVTMAQPVFTPAPGLYTTPQLISINTNVIPSNAVIHYTVDGTTPNESSPIYVTPISIGANQQIVINVRAYAANWIPSDVQTGVYNVTDVVSPVTFNPIGGVYTTEQSVFLSTTTSEASIRYTTDGSEPTSISTLYTSAIIIPLNTSMTIKAKAFKVNWTSSTTTEQTYVITGQVAFGQPVFTPAEGIYTTPQSVTISAPIPADATVRYTTDGSNPSETVGTIYSGSIPVNTSQTIKAIAYKANWTSTSIISATYEITGQVADVTFGIPGGTYQVAQDITLTTVTPGAVIRYTTDGSEPSEASASYNTPINIPLNSTVTLKAKAYKTGWNPSNTTSQTYVITGQIVFNQPVFNPVAGIYTTAQTISLNSVIPSDAVIRYTTNGTEPDLTSNIYAAPFLLPLNSTLDLKVKAFKANWISSDTYSAFYTVTGQVTLSQPFFTPAPGLYTTPQLISFNTSVIPTNAVIHYTIDGTTPNESSPVYVTPISIGANQQIIINAKAYAANWLPSDVQTGVYNVTDMVAPVTFNPIGGVYTTEQSVFLSTTTSEASIRYTTDGSEPTSFSTLYTSAIIIPLNTSMTIRAKAFKVNWTSSVTVAQTYVITGQIAFNQPVFTPAEGVYTTPQSVTISAPIPADATVRYTTDGSIPSETVGTIYTGSIPVNASQTIKAIAYKTNWASSDIVSATYEITGQVAVVTFNPLGGTYQTAQNISLSTVTSGATIRYTTDGSEPSEASASYAAPINIPLNSTVMLKAKAYKTNWDPSATTTQTYVITGQIVFNQPVFNPPAGIYTSPQTISLNTVVPADATIRYTTDGTDPTLASPIYTPIQVPLNSTLNLKVKAFKANWTASLTYSASYTVTGQVTMAQPIFTPPPGLYTTPQLISINTSVIPSNAVIHYTVDGSTPTESSPVYSAPISIGANQQIIINVRAFAANWLPGDIQTGLYNITDVVAPVTFNPLGGTFTTAQNVLLSTVTDGASIRYTTDGSDPTTGSTLYTTAINVPLNTSVTIRAKGFKTNWTPSSTTSQTYVVTGQVAFTAPTFTPAAGVYPSAQVVTISAPVPSDATVRYTTDGTDPSTTQGTIYAGPITVSNTQTIKAIAYKANWTSSVIVSALYEITGQVAAVTFNPLGGTYQTEQNVTLTTVTPGATIRYTTNGDEPSEASASYSTPINIALNKNITLKAKAFKLNWTPSITTSQTYVVTGQVTFNTPVFTPVAGIYTSAQTITVNTVEPADATIRYTTDGTDPVQTSTIYTTPLSVPLNSTLNLKVKAFKTDWTSSQTYSASYTVTGQVTMAQPIFTPAPGLYTTPQTVSINTSVVPATAVIHYTTDGTTPTASSPVYTTPISIGANTQMVINVRAFAANWLPGDIQTGIYTITGQVAPVVFNPNGGSFTTAQNVVLSTTTDGATIRYTTDGSEPTLTSPLYVSAINAPLNATTVIKAKAFKTNWTPSVTNTQTYVVTGQVAFSTPIFFPPAGIYTNAVNVAFNPAIPADATIRFTTDGTNPSETVGTVYTGPFNVSVTTTVKAIAYKTGWTSSAIATALYEITGQVAAVTFNPTGGTYQTPQNVTLSTTTPGATIRYTMNGDDPSEASASYTTPIYIGLDTSIQIKAQAYKTNWIPSAITVQTYNVTGQVAFNSPVITPVAGIYTTPQLITLNTTYPADAVVRYTTDGSDPSETVGTIYTEPFTVDTTQTIKAIAYKAGWTTSTIITASYIITGQVAAVVFDIPGGTYQAAQTVNLSTTTPGAVIRYTTDSTEPNITSALYTEPFIIPLNTTLLIKAKAFKTDWDPSETTMQTYVITGQVAFNLPIFSLAEGTYTSDQVVSLGTTYPTDALIRYTMDGSDPTTTTGELYTAPIALTGNTTLKVMAYKTGWVNSDITSAVYQFQTADPVLSQVSGIYPESFTLTLSCTTPNAEIRYTTDGTEPTAASQLYSEGIVIADNVQNFVVKAIAFKANWLTSSSVSATYSVLLLPVNVRAYAYAGYIRISWNSPIIEGRTLDGFNVYRKRIGDSGFTKINSTLVNTHADSVYYYDDYNIQANESYQYYVTAVYNGIESNPSNSTTIEYVTQGLLISDVTHAYPNPATNSCKIKLVLSRNDNVQLTVSIYDFAGKKVQTLTPPTTNSNMIEIPWDLKTSGGEKVARGTYFARVVANNGIDRSEKIIKIAVK